MKTLVTILALCALSFAFSGCSTLATSPASSQTQELAAYTLTKNAVLLVLQKEPAAEGPLVALSTGIDAVFASGELSPDQLKLALDTLRVNPKSQLLIASALTDVYNLYVAATGKKIVVTTDPVASAILKGVKRGITDGVTFAHLFNAAPL